jgi:hypothetical protein
MSPALLEEYFGRSWRAIRLRAWKIGLSRPRPINTKINHSYFHNISSVEQAYWLGWIASDGSVSISNKGYYVSLQLQLRDKAIVEKFVQTVAPGHTTFISRNSICVRIASKDMYHDLVNKGIVPNKTYSLCWPKNLPDELAMAFLLGYFDGDGCLAEYTYGKKRRIHWVLLGTKPFLEVAKQYIEQYAQVTLSTPSRAHKHKSEHLYKLRTCNRLIVSRIDAVLNASHLGLARKHL